MFFFRIGLIFLISFYGTNLFGQSESFYSQSFDSLLGLDKLINRVNTAGGGSCVAPFMPSTRMEGIPLPEIISRSDWKAKGEYSRSELKDSNVFKIIVHHTVDKNGEKYGANHIQKIEDSHTLSTNKGGKGFKGIAYNFLITPDGKVYEGVGMKYRGAHADTKKFRNNNFSIGIALVGNYEKYSVRNPTGDRECSNIPVKQAQSLAGLVKKIKQIYPISVMQTHQEATSRKTTSCSGGCSLNTISRIRTKFRLSEW